MTLTEFPRTVLPHDATMPEMAAADVSIADSGAASRSGAARVGRVWRETYIPVLMGLAASRAFFTELERLRRSGEAFLVDHRSLRSLIGTGLGTPRVNGAGQSGEYLVTDGWTAGATMQAGDVLRIAALGPVYDVTEDATADGSGNMVLRVNPPIYPGGEPSDDAVITVNQTAGAVKFRAFLESFTVPRVEPGQIAGSATAQFRELVEPLVATTLYRSGDALTGLTYDRDSVAYYRAQSGIWTQVAADVLRDGHFDPNGVRVTLVERAATARLANGGVAGTLGAQPTSFGVAAGNTVVVSNDIADITGNSQVAKHTRNPGSTVDTNIGFLGYTSAPGATQIAGEVWVYIPAAFVGTEVSARWESNVSVNPITQADLSKRDQWQVLRVTGTTDADGGTTNIVLRAICASDGQVVYSDAWSAEDGTFATSWIPSGTRAAATLWVPHTRRPEEASLYFRFTELGSFRNAFETGKSPRIGQIGNSSDTGARWAVYAAGGLATYNVGFSHDGSGFDFMALTHAHAMFDTVELLAYLRRDGRIRLQKRVNFGAITDTGWSATRRPMPAAWSDERLWIGCIGTAGRSAVGMQAWKYIPELWPMDDMYALSRVAA